MTFFSSHHDGRYGSADGFSISRALRRLRVALKKIHRTIAAAKIRRVRNELRLRAATRAQLAHPRRSDVEVDGSGLPRQPLYLGDKWDF